MTVSLFDCVRVLLSVQLTSANIDLEEQRAVASSLSDKKDSLARQLEDMHRRLVDAEDNMPKQMMIARAEAKV